MSITPENLGKPLALRGYRRFQGVQKWMFFHVYGSLSCGNFLFLSRLSHTPRKFFFLFFIPLPYAVPYQDLFSYR